MDTCALLTIRGVHTGNAALCQELESSCHELLIQRSVFSLAANHQTHKVVFNSLSEEGLGCPCVNDAPLWSPRECRIFRTSNPSPGCRWPVWSVPVNLSWNQEQENLYWLHQLLRELWLPSVNSSFLLTPVNALWSPSSLPICLVKRMRVAFLATGDITSSNGESWWLCFFFWNVCTCWGRQGVSADSQKGILTLTNANVPAGNPLSVIA